MPDPSVVDALTAQFAGEPFPLGVQVPPARLLEALRALRDRHGYRYYICTVGTDRKTGFEVVHGVRRLESFDEIWIKVLLPPESPTVDSAAFVYAGAEWHEREILDLIGVTFTGHPDPRRIMMPEEYEGHPLRKSFPIDAPWGYRPAAAEAEGGSGTAPEREGT